MSCPTCQNEARNTQHAKLDILKPKFRVEAAAKGLEEFAIIKTINDNPGFAWRQTDSPDCERLGVVEICVVY